MALPGSGAIGTDDIRTELGGSGPVAIPGAETRALTGIASGPITLPDDFWGKSAADVTPNAVNWANISGSAPGSNTNANQTISGIDTNITLRADVTGFSGIPPDIQYRINGGSWVLISAGAFVVSDGDTVNFQGSASAGGSVDVTVYNESDSDTVLDTFTATFS